MQQLLTDNQVRELLRSRISRFKSQNAFGRANGIRPNVLSASVTDGVTACPVTPKVAEILGLKRVVMFEVDGRLIDEHEAVSIIRDRGPRRGILSAYKHVIKFYEKNGSLKGVKKFASRALGGRHEYRFTSVA